MERHGSRTYNTRAFSCKCPDATQRSVVCKHSYAMLLLHAMSAAARRELLVREHAPIPIALTNKALAALDEAPVPA